MKNTSRTENLEVRSEEIPPDKIADCDTSEMQLEFPVNSIINFFSDAKEQLMRKRSGSQKARKRRTVVKELVHKWKQFPISIIIKGESGGGLNLTFNNSFPIWRPE